MGGGMNVLFIINGSAYGQDATYNGLRVTAAITGQKAPEGYYHLDRMLGVVVQHGGEVGCCGTCMDARGITEGMLTGSTRRATMEELADWTLAAGKVLGATFVMMMFSICICGRCSKFNSRAKRCLFQIAEGRPVSAYPGGLRTSLIWVHRNSIPTT